MEIRNILKTGEIDKFRFVYIYRNPYIEILFKENSEKPGKWVRYISIFQCKFRIKIISCIGETKNVVPQRVRPFWQNGNSP